MADDIQVIAVEGKVFQLQYTPLTTEEFCVYKPLQEIVQVTQLLTSTRVKAQLRGTKGRNLAKENFFELQLVSGYNWVEEVQEKFIVKIRLNEQLCHYKIQPQRVVIPRLEFPRKGKELVVELSLDWSFDIPPQLVQ